MERTKVMGTLPPPTGWLVLRTGSRAGHDHRLAAETTIGRDGASCDLILDDEAVSARHALVRFERNQFVIHDLASTNGTFVNGEKVDRVTLTDGDTVTLGGTRMIFKQVRTSER